MTTCETLTHISPPIAADLLSVTRKNMWLQLGDMQFVQLRLYVFSILKENTHFYTLENTYYQCFCLFGYLLLDFKTKIITFYHFWSSIGKLEKIKIKRQRKSFFLKSLHLVEVLLQQREKRVVWGRSLLTGQWVISHVKHPGRICGCVLIASQFAWKYTIWGSWWSTVPIHQKLMLTRYAALKYEPVKQFHKVIT